MTGCTTGHEGVVRLVSRLRLIHGVERVSLADSVKADAAVGGGGAASSNDGDCRHGNANFPQFDVVVFFAPLPAAPAPASADPAAAGERRAAPPRPAPTGGGAQ